MMVMNYLRTLIAGVAVEDGRVQIGLVYYNADPDVIFHINQYVVFETILSYLWLSLPVRYGLQMRISYLSRVVRKPAFSICENKDADQLRGNREADQRLCFRYIDSTIPLLPTYEISSL